VSDITPSEFLRRLGSRSSGLATPREPSHKGDVAWLIGENPTADVAASRFIAWMVQTGRITEPKREG